MQRQIQNSGLGSLGGEEEPIAVACRSSAPGQSQIDIRRPRPKVVQQNQQIRELRVNPTQDLVALSL